MGTNFYFFRPLTEREKEAIQIVSNLCPDPEDWTPPIPLAVPEEIQALTEKSAIFRSNRSRFYDDLRDAEHLGPWDRGKAHYRYWRSLERYKNHIGKRSAAGLYCWDCKVTLCVDGRDGVHKGKSQWLTKCPSCGQTPPERSNEALRIEMGFRTPLEQAPKGISSCCSFSWALDDRAFLDWSKSHLDEICIRDEYSQEMSVGDFVTMLQANCPIQFFDSIGIEFS